MIASPPAIVQAAPVAQPTTGAALGVLIIPRFGLHVVFRQGVTAAVIDRGPGHYPSTSLPGTGGTIAIAGHRVTHTRPFLSLNRLRKRDRIVLVTNRRYVYRVYRMRIVSQREVWPLRSGHREQVVLTACHPPRTDARRLVVFAHLVSSTPA